MSIFFFHSFLLVLNQENNHVYTHFLHPPYYIPVCNVHRTETQQTRASHTHTRVASHSGDGRCKLMAGCRQVSVARTCCGELSTKIDRRFRYVFSKKRKFTPDLWVVETTLFSTTALCEGGNNLLLLNAIPSPPIADRWVDWGKVAASFVYRTGLPSCWATRLLTSRVSALRFLI